MGKKKPTEKQEKASEPEAQSPKKPKQEASSISKSKITKKKNNNEERKPTRQSSRISQKKELQKTPEKKGKKELEPESETESSSEDDFEELNLDDQNNNNNNNNNHKSLMNIEVNPHWSERFETKEAKELFDKKTLKDMGYYLKPSKKQYYELRKISDDSPFEFEGQLHYERLGDLVAFEVQQYLKKDFEMEEKWIPSSQKPENPEDGKGIRKNFPQVNIFHTKNFFTNPDKILILTCGTGLVMAGQWARRLCVNNELKLGTIFDYLKKAKELGYDVLVVNPNALRAVTEKSEEKVKKEEERYLQKEKLKKTKSKRKKVELYETVSRRKLSAVKKNVEPFQHMLYVYDNFVTKTKAEHIVMVAHSFGGYTSTSLLSDREKSILPRIRAIAFTDAVHSFSKHWPKSVKDFLKEHGQNWLQSSQPLGKPLKARSGSPCVSSGTPVHEETSGYAIDEVFQFLEKHVQDYKNTKGSPKDEP